MAAKKTCKNPGCSKKFTPTGRQIYCAEKCKKSHYWKKNKKEELPKNNTTISSTSRGNDYPKFVEEYAAKLEQERVTDKQVADAMGISRSVVTKMYAAYLEDKNNLLLRNRPEILRTGNRRCRFLL